MSYLTRSCLWNYSNIKWNKVITQSTGVEIIKHWLLFVERSPVVARIIRYWEAFAILGGELAKRTTMGLLTRESLFQKVFAHPGTSFLFIDFLRPSLFYGGIWENNTSLCFTITNRYCNTCWFLNPRLYNADRLFL